MTVLGQLRGGSVLLFVGNVKTESSCQWSLKEGISRTAKSLGPAAVPQLPYIQVVFRFCKQITSYSFRSPNS